MKKSIFLFFAAILCSVSAWAGPTFSGGYVYFHNKGNWNQSSRQLCIGKNSYTATYTMAVVTNTQLWYNALPTSGWNDATYMAVINNSSNWGSGNWGPSNLTNAKHYTKSVDLGNWGFNSGNFQMLTPADGNNNATLKLTYEGNNIASMNKTITIKAKVSTDEGNSFTEATSPAELSASSYKFSDYKTCGTTTSLESNKIACGYTANTTLTAKEVEGYNFNGWYDASGNKQTAELTLSLNPTVDATYYAYYTREALIEENHDVTISFMCGATSLKTSTTATGVGISTPSEITAPVIDDYTFSSWTLGSGIATTDATTANPINITTKAGESDYTLVANYAEVPKAKVYFINTLGWTNVKAYAYTPEENASWPGVDATLEAEKIGGYDVYSYTATQGKYANVIFNGNGDQTADLTWTADKYYIHNYNGNSGWYTQAEAETILVTPLEYESVYFINTNNWTAVNIYTWGPEVGTWPGVAMTKEDETIAGKDVYSYTVVKGTKFDGIKFDEGQDKAQTGDLTWQAGKYYAPSKSKWYDTKEAANEDLTPSFTLTVTANDNAMGSVEGAGTYKQGATATLTATPAEGYEFVNWTKGEEVVTENPYTFIVTENVTLVANFKKKVSIITETYTLPADAADTNRGDQWYVEVPGEEEAKYQIIIPGYEGPGTYEEVTWRVNMNGDWTAMSATVTVTYDEENNLDVYVISATTEDSSTIYNVTLNVEHKEAEEKPEAAIIPLESYMPKVTKIIDDWGDETEPWLVTSYIWTNGAYDPIEFNLTVTLAAGFAPSLEGYINETFVIGVENEVLAGEEEGYAILRAQATDGTNTYTIDLMAELTTEEEGGTRAITVIEAEIYPNSDNKTALDIYGWSDTDEEVTVTLWEGTSKLYGEYTDDLNVYIGGWNQYYLAEETTATFALVDGLAVFNATVVNGNDTVVLTISGAPWVNPKDIVPTDTVNHTIVDGTIEVKLNMFLNISGSSDDISVNISTTNKTTTSEDIENCSSAYVEIDDEQINLLRGQFEIVTVGDVKIAYIGALGADHKWYNIIVTTGSEAPTALDNLGTTVAPVKVIVNGQLIITKDGVQYNAQGAVVK